MTKTVRPPRAVHPAGLRRRLVDGDPASEPAQEVGRLSKAPSLITAAETLGTRKIFTIDFRDFSVYRIRRGHRQDAVEIVT
jgi:hypothetical protein